MYHVTVVLSLCLCLLSPWVAQAQTAPATPVDDPLGDLVEDASAKKPSAADQAEEPAASRRKAAPGSAEQPPYPADAAQSEPAPEQTPAADESTKLRASDKDAAAETGEASQAEKERCAQLMAQGQTALAQAEGCGGGDQPIWAGSTLSFTQTTAPAYRTLPDSNNGYYSLGLTIAPRLTLSEKWALNSDFSLGYEVTQPDTMGNPNQVVSSDTRLTATGNLGSVGGFTFTGGPRVVVPTSKASWAQKMYAGTGAALNIIKNFDVLAGWAFIAGGSYVHNWSGRLTPKIRGANEETNVQIGSGTAPVTGPECFALNNTSQDCSSGNSRVVQDSLRAVAATSLNVTPTVNFQLSYIYGWSLVKPFKDATPVVASNFGPELQVSDNVLPDSRWRTFGSLGLSASYQPTTWLIASVQASTSVCYSSESGGQSAFGGGCAGGMKVSSFALRNPIANKFSNLGLQFTIPLDALYDRIKNGGAEEKKTAAAKRAAKL